MRDVYNAIQHPEMPAPMTDPAFTLEEFAAWLMAQPGDTSFNTDSIVACPLAQFLKATGRMHLGGFVRTLHWLSHRRNDGGRTHLIDLPLAFILTGHFPDQWVPARKLLDAVKREIHFGWTQRDPAFEKWAAIHHRGVRYD